MILIIRSEEIFGKIIRIDQFSQYYSKYLSLDFETYQNNSFTYSNLLKFYI